MSRVHIGIPCNRHIRPQTVQSLLDLVKDSEYDLTFSIESSGFTVAENRNKIVTAAKEARAKHLLFVDDDMKFPPDILKKLMSSDKNIIGVNSRSRDGSNAITVKPLAQIAQMIPNKVFECSAVGTGILLINMEVFKDLPKPYFAFETYKDGKTKTGEDIYFCNQARDYGFKIWCDATIDIKHIGDYEY